MHPRHGTDKADRQLLGSNHYLGRIQSVGNETFTYSARSGQPQPQHRNGIPEEGVRLMSIQDPEPHQTEDVPREQRRQPLIR